MKKWYFGVALLAAWLSPAAVPAQHIPSPIGAARCPDPMPICAPDTPPLVPGPPGPDTLPPGPPIGIDLPADHSSAFQWEEYVTDQHCYAHFGATGLMRQKIGNQPLASVDPQNLDTGNVPFGQQPTVINTSNVAPLIMFGPRATLGYLYQNHAIEVSGFYLPEYRHGTDVTMPGQLDLPFVNPPIGFEGDNGLWLQADRVVTDFRNSMWSAEVNYRYTNGGIHEGELLLGLRYVDMYESLSVFTDDDGVLQPGAGGIPDPTRQATYQVQTHNRIVAPQIGFDWGYSHPWFTLGVNGKAALGLDFADIQYSLTRGDGLVGFNTRRSETIAVTQIYEAGAYIDLKPMERMHVHLGYNAMFLVRTATAIDQIDFNLANTTGRVNNNGNLFYHGPMIEFQFLF